MAVKQFPQDFPDISSDATKVLGSKLDGTIGSVNMADVKIETSKRVVGAGIFSKGYNGQPPTGPVLYSIMVGNVGYLGAYNYGSSTPLDLLINDAGGNVAIGKPSASQKLDVGGNIIASGTITPGSDKRLKKYIKNIPTGALELISQLRPVSYSMKSDGAASLGFIADEVREIFPELVLEGKDEEKMLSMNYMGLTAPIVKAMQEMSATIDQLKAEIAELKSI